MGRLIEADAFDKRIRLDVGSCEEELTEDFKDGISTILEMMKTAPTVDAVPVRHGRWINGKCDKCGGHAPFWAMATTYYPSKFCPNCGARMDLKDGDGNG